MGSKAGQKLGVVRKTEKLGERERKALFPSEGKGHDDDDDDDEHGFSFKYKIV